MEILSDNLTTRGESRSESVEIPRFEIWSAEVPGALAVNIYTPESPLRRPLPFLREMFRDCARRVNLPGGCLCAIRALNTARVCSAMSGLFFHLLWRAFLSYS